MISQHRITTFERCRGAAQPSAPSIPQSSQSSKLFAARAHAADFLLSTRVREFNISRDDAREWAIAAFSPRDFWPHSAYFAAVFMPLDICAKIACTFMLSFSSRLSLSLLFYIQCRRLGPDDDDVSAAGARARRDGRAARHARAACRPQILR